MNNFVEYVQMVFTIKYPRLPNSKKILLVVMKQMISEIVFKNPENVEEFTNIRRIFTAVVRHATISFYDCGDSTKIIENNCFVKNPGKLVKNPENFEELTKIEESSHPLLNIGTI